MKILIACQFFNYCSGSAMYVHDLAVELKKRNHEVTILSELGGEVSSSALKHGIRLIDFSQIFTIQDEKFDVLHLNQYGPADMALQFFEDTPAVFTIHSELSIENPYIHPNIKKYIAIRPTIVDKYKELDPVLVWNGIDFERFNTKNKETVEKKKQEVHLHKEIVLFVGTIDTLRAPAIKDLIDKTRQNREEFWVVGRNFLPFKLPDAVKMMPETFFSEKWVEMADVCAGILVGRTAIEAWACGKPYVCYDIDDAGSIQSVTRMEPPADMTQYDIKFMTSSIENTYNELQTH